MTASPPRRGPSRRWLYLPFLLLAVLALGWSGFWYVVSGRVAEAVDAALLRESGAGRDWRCADRSIGGFPFRIELRCSGLTLTSRRWQEPVTVTTGPLLALGQIYSPGLVIVEADGPLHAALPQGRVLRAEWTGLRASLSFRARRIDQSALVLSGLAASLAAPGQPAEEARAETLELHLRRSPDRPAGEPAVDIALDAAGATIPAIDALFGLSGSGTILLRAALTRTGPLEKGLSPAALDAWRDAGGQIEVSRFAAGKGTARIEANGRLALDQSRRLAGQVQAGIAGVEQVAGIRIGGLAAGLGSLFAGNRGPTVPDAPSLPADLTPVPPIVLREGRLSIGPLRLPLPPLAPLY